MATVTLEAVRHDKSGMLSLYRTMQTIRQCEEQLARAHQRGPDPRRLPHLRRRGGDRRRASAHICGATTSSSARIAAWPRAGQGSAAARADRRAVRPRDRLLARPRRQHAPVRARGRHDGHQRHRRPVHPAGRRRGLQLQAARRPTAWPSPSSATARSTTARSTKG